MPKNDRDPSPPAQDTSQALSRRGLIKSCLMTMHDGEVLAIYELHLSNDHHY